MGWASGSDVMAGVVKAARRHMKDEAARERFYRDVILVMEDHDCDTLNEVMHAKDPAYNRAFKAHYKKRYGEEWG